jgi:hypothetical protein
VFRGRSLTLFLLWCKTPSAPAPTTTLSLPMLERFSLSALERDNDLFRSPVDTPLVCFCRRFGL